MFKEVQPTLEYTTKTRPHRGPASQAISAVYALNRGIGGSLAGGGGVPGERFEVSLVSGRDRVAVLGVEAGVFPGEQDLPGQGQPVGAETPRWPLFASSNAL